MTFNTIIYWQSFKSNPWYLCPTRAFHMIICSLCKNKAWSPYSYNGSKHRCKHISDSVPSNFVKPSVHLIVTIATIAEKFVSDRSDQMDTSLLTIPTIVTIVTIAIAGMGSGSIPAIASAIVTIVTIATIVAIIWTQASDRERSEQSSYFPRCIAVQVHFMLILISCQNNMILEVFLTIGTIKWT